MCMCGGSGDLHVILRGFFTQYKFLCCVQYVVHTCIFCVCNAMGRVLGLKGCFVIIIIIIL